MDWQERREEFKTFLRQFRPASAEGVADLSPHDRGVCGRRGPADRRRHTNANLVDRPYGG